VQYNPTNITLNAVGPAVGLNPTSLSFGNQVVGTTSPAQTVTVTNTGSVPLTITSASVTGTNAAEFSETADTCTNATLNAGATCTVSVTFTPSAQGARSATLTFEDNGSGSPHTVPLTGTDRQPRPRRARSRGAALRGTASGRQRATGRPFACLRRRTTPASPAPSRRRS
jgi:hypothetical protein